MTDKRMWTTLEIKRALSMQGDGLSHVRIADALGRSRGSVSTMFRDLKRRNSRVDRIVRKPEPEMFPVPFDEAEGSERLKVATIQALLRWAHSNGTTIDDAAGFLISGKSIGTGTADLPAAIDCSMSSQNLQAAA